MTEDTPDAPADVPQIAPAALQDRLDAGNPVRVLDLRDRDAVERWRLSGPSVTLTQKPHNRFVQASVTESITEFVADVDGEGPITVVCARGEASAAVADALTEAGYDARNLAGGMKAWARLVRTVELDAGLPGDGALVQYRRPSSGCLGYLIVAGDGEPSAAGGDEKPVAHDDEPSAAGDDENAAADDGAGAKRAALVDPLAAFTERYVADLDERNATLEYVVDTHVHADHVSGLRDLADATGATPVMSERAIERGVTFADAVRTVTDGDELAVGATTVEAVAAPGHTTGMTALAVGDALLTGDSLFVESVARPDLERGAEEAADLARDLYRTLTERFARFPDETVVAPGHHAEGARPGGDGSVTATLGACRALRVFGMDEADFVSYVTGDMPPRPANFERMIAINLGRETVGEEEAFELELGPNNCAATPAADD